MTIMNKLPDTFPKKSTISAAVLITIVLFLFYADHVYAQGGIKLSETDSYNADAVNLNVLDADCSQLYYDFLLKIAKEQFNSRRQIISSASQNKGKVQEYQIFVKNHLSEIINSFPEKTPLNPKTTGIIKCEDYRIEKIIFESRPNLYIPGNLYIPTKKNGPFPAVLEACGHELNGKANINYQSIAILLAKNGFVVLVIDTYTQGERDPINHTQIDIGAMLVGSDVVTYQAWDNIRAIDYLCSRPEVDPLKIGMTGNSGGGTQTMYTMGLDPRIKVAAISSGLQTRERMFTWNGLADGCHNFAGEGKKMLEYGDYIILSAPKPVLILAGEKDPTFDIEAVSKTFREAKRFYKELGAMDHLDFYAVDGGHDYVKKARETAVWWFKKWLLNETGIVIEPRLTLQPDEKLSVTKTGQTLTEFKNAVSIIDINIQQAKNLENQRKMFWQNNSKLQCIAKIKELINYQDDPYFTKAIQSGYGRDATEKGIQIRKLHLVGRDGFPLPALLYVPVSDKSSLPATLYLDSGGKKNAFRTDSALNDLVKSGRIVLAVDLRGFGETTVDLGELRKSLHDLNDQHLIAQTTLYIGQTLIGQRVQDAIDVLGHLCSYPMVNKSDIELVGIGQCGPVALHVATIDPRITSVRIINSITSWMDIISEPEAKNQFKNVVPFAMKYYDLPDLVDVITPRSVEITKPVDVYGKLKK